MPQKRKSGYALDDSDEIDTFDGPAAVTSTKRSNSKRSKQTASTTAPTDATPIITSAHFADVPTSQSPKTDDEGSLYWDISKARRVTVSEYRGKKMVGIREYYEKDGQMLPGKKGITMTLEQYGVLVSLLPGIEAELNKSGITDVPRPDYEKVIDDQEEEVEEDDENGHARRGKGGGRPNHEATSDEEEE